MKFIAIRVLIVVVVVMTIVQAVPLPSPQDLNIQFTCKQNIKRGNCRALIPRWMYDVKRGVCLEFKYGGCGGNNNNFETKSECEYVCKGVRL